MQWVRKYRHRFILVFSLGAIAAMTYGFLKRIGMDPLSPSTTDSGAALAVSGGDCDPQPYDGRCELVSATAIQFEGRRAVRAQYRLVDTPRRPRVERIVVGETIGEIEAEPQMVCRGEWMAGPCPTGPFVFSR